MCEIALRHLYHTTSQVNTHFGWVNSTLGISKNCFCIVIQYQRMLSISISLYHSPQQSSCHTCCSWGPGRLHNSPRSTACLKDCMNEIKMSEVKYSSSPFSSTKPVSCSDLPHCSMLQTKCCGHQVRPIAVMKGPLATLECWILLKYCCILIDFHHRVHGWKQINSKSWY